MPHDPTDYEIRADLSGLLKVGFRMQAELESLRDRAESAWGTEEEGVVACLVEAIDKHNQTMTSLISAISTASGEIE